MITAYLEYSVNVDCPKCEESTDLVDRDDDHTVSLAISSNKWDDLKGYEVTCEHCGHEFKIDNVEY